MSKKKPGGELKIVVPSHRRHDLLTTHKCVSIDAVCVAESQLSAYRENFPDVEYVTHPDDVVGLHAKRQWIYDHFGNVFMFDDDLRYVARRYQGQVCVLPEAMKPDEVRKAVLRLFEMATDAGAYLFGFSNIFAPMTYRPWKPFTFTGMVMGGAYGVRAGSKLYWNPRMISKEDTWISALNCHFHRIIVRDNRFFARTEGYMTRPGGLTGQRTTQTEAADNQILYRVFGEQSFERRLPPEGNAKTADTVKSTESIAFKAPF